MVIDAGDSRTRGRSVRFPIDSKLGTSLPPFLGQQVSIDQTGGSESMAKASDVDIGIGNTWTASMWVNPNSATQTNNTRLLLIRPNSGSANIIEMSLLTGPDRIRVNNISSVPVNIKVYHWNTFLVADTWSFIVLTWDGTDLLLYHQGSELAADSEDTDNAGTMTSTNRQIGVGAFHSGSATASFDGKLHSYGIWDVVLDAAAVTELYNSGAGELVEYDTDGTNYTSSADLLHWWRLGFNSGDIGKDYGTHSTLIDVMDDATGIDATDIVASYPGE